jgi:hypothetical protein
MATKLTANFIFSGIEDDVIMIGFADDEFDTKEHLLLQKSLEFDEQDKTLGQDKVHITYIDELYSAYGGVQKVILKSNSVEIQLSASTAKVLQTEEQIEILLAQQGTSNIEELKHYLQLMFKEEPNVFLSEI